MSLRFLAPLFFCLLSQPSYAEELLTFESAWVREGPPVAKVLAGFMTIKNNSDNDIIITGAKSEDFDTIELHRTLFEDGIARMVEQKNLHIPANGQLVLEPGSYHLMLIGAKRTLKAGDEINVYFYTATEYCIDQVLPVKKSTGNNDMQHHHHH